MTTTIMMMMFDDNRSSSVDQTSTDDGAISNNNNEYLNASNNIDILSIEHQQLVSSTDVDLADDSDSKGNHRFFICFLFR
jgi:hypothetical protein